MPASFGGGDDDPKTRLAGHAPLLAKGTSKTQLTAHGPMTENNDEHLEP
jgi:hypothetical protein